jgi:hypothetical protein
MRAGNDVAVNFLERGLRLFQIELLVSARLLKHLLAGSDTNEGAARRHRFDIAGGEWPWPGRTLGESSVAY